MTDVVYPVEPPTEPPTDAGEEPPVDGERPPPPPEEQRRPVALVGIRFGELFLEFVLMVCTFGFGWVGWWIIAWADGQSPAKAVLRLHVVEAKTGRLASFGRMAVRETFGKGIAGVFALVGLYYGLPWLVALTVLYALVGAAIAATNPRKRMLWDLLAGTVVLEGDPPPLVTAVERGADADVVVIPPVEADTSLS